MENKRGQVAIFIIIAIVIVIGIVAVLMFYGRLSPTTTEDLNPSAFMDKCVKDEIELSVEKVLVGGGRIDPSLYEMYVGDKYNYLCYQENYYWTCVNLHPLLKEIVEEEIKVDTEDDVVRCFDDLLLDLEGKGFDVSAGALSYDVELEPGKVIAKIEKKLDVVKSGSRTFEDFEVSVLSPLYELVMIARDVVNQEAQYCNFDYNGFMLLYPDYDIKRISYDDSRIYKIKDRRSGREFRFAVRSCVLPAGL